MRRGVLRGGRTQHDGWSTDAPPDALGLLRAAEKGAQWRCVEFGIAVTGSLQAVGIPARTVGGLARPAPSVPYPVGLAPCVHCFNAPARSPYAPTGR